MNKTKKGYMAPDKHWHVIILFPRELNVALS